MPKGGTVTKSAAPTKFEALIQESVNQTRTQKLVPAMDELLNMSSITQMVDLIVQKAWEASASDIHIDPGQNEVIVRYRIDGILHDVVSIKKELQPLIITRIKVLAGLRTDEHAMAQDGRFRVVANSNEVDLRVSIVPTYSGENVVMRLLKTEAKVITLAELGFSERDLQTLHTYINRPYGMILSTGPTGSGKTTTLYSIMDLLNSRNVSIITIEDPIEYSVPGITQIQVNTQTNLTFADGLRSIVRQDPNVILVGEIRDPETAGTAVNAAMTGHLLLSTLHTNDAATTLPRLIDMHIEPFLIASTVNVAIGQRLVRRLCENCKASYVPTGEDLAALSRLLPPELMKQAKTFWKPAGCDACSHTGYRKRVGIYELLEMKEPIRRLIMQRATADEVREAAREQGMTTMLEDGFTKAMAGITSIEEILRVVHE